MKTPVLVLHGGAGDRAPGSERIERLLKSLERILVDVYPRLLRGGSALDTVVRAVQALEDDPLYNAGRGSKIQSDGHIRMSAALMDGDRRRFAGCVNVEGLKNPILLAKSLLKKNDRVLSGAGARAYARELGLEFASPFTRETRLAFAKAKRGKTGTVGAVALDSQGRLAAATSTGGKGMEYPGRVSDSPTSAGNFATEVCAVSMTGVGEEIVEFSAASTICAYMDSGKSLTAAVNLLLKKAKGKQFGLIALDRKGNFEARTNTPALTWAAATPSGFEFMPRD